MSLTFAYPPHLSQYSTSNFSPLRSLTITAAKPEPDPHNVPVFDAKKLAPVLYLPPLLSSLPETYPSIPIPTENPPLITQTRLPDIDPASLSLHKALHHFRPYTESYAETPYGEAFNWDQLVLPEYEERDWYCVVFRSKRKAGSDGDSLYEADKKAHEEAVHNGGLLLYWYGIPNQETGMNLATCIWQSRQHAIAANSCPNHIQAMRLAAQSYEVYDLERHVLRKVAGSTRVSIEPFTGGEVGW
ncbi:hypothetical protein DFH07DRAFT_758523 [Mycena maculata]|uniref:Uncharacterized protein n=1 Tax=Mycena maculata TaxID=230809 RepID=A0AAD7MP86_9AGAR|nr:hypothetical protein DFH07DRAFT_758523 [Mycena maculata]